MSKFGQVFYGRGKDGYGILGASPSGRPFVGFVATLCRAVGSPDRPGDIRPFLISKREGDSIVMIRACRGDSDPTGRSTLFFHALVASVDDLSSTNVDAFALSGKEVFLSALPQVVEDVEVSVPTSKVNALPSGELRFPALIASDHPLDVEVRRILGRETLTRNWATYSYRSLDGFDLCVHSSYATPSTFGNHYTFTGERFVPNVDEAPRTSLEATSKIASPLTPLKVSFALNVVLVIVVLVLFATRGNGTKSPHVVVERPATLLNDTAQTLPEPVDVDEDEARKKWENTWRKEWTRNMGAEFEAMLSDANLARVRLPFEKTSVERIPYFKQVLKQPQSDPARQFYDSCRAYVDFIETRFFTSEQKEDNHENNQ